MELTPDWEEGLRAELQCASARTYQRIVLTDPWHRALTCCFKAQQIRQRRTRNYCRRQKVTSESLTEDWDAGFKIAVQEARQRNLRRSRKGRWDYAMRLKLNAWRMRAKDCINGNASARLK